MEIYMQIAGHEGPPADIRKDPKKHVDKVVNQLNYTFPGTVFIFKKTKKLNENAFVNDFE